MKSWLVSKYLPAGRWPDSVVNNSLQFVSKSVADARAKQPVVYFTRAVDHILRQRFRVSGLLEAAGVFIFLSVASLASAQNQADPYVVKEYPDGSKVKLRWSQVSSRPDSGTARGGVPTIRAMAKGEENLPEEDTPAPVDAPPKVPPPPAGSPDVKVMKVYPDGTQLIVPWSDLGKSMDQGEAHGGPPKIVPYDPRGGSTPTPTKAPAAGRLGPAVTSVENPPAKKPVAGSSPASRTSPAPPRPLWRPKRPAPRCPAGFPPLFRGAWAPRCSMGRRFRITVPAP